MPTSLLLVEDEIAIARPLTQTLQREGFKVRAATTGSAAMAELRSAPVDLVLLDLKLPDVDGRDLCARIRAVSEVPIIIVTASSGEIDRIVGLELGADDYVAKPFSALELIARIRAVLRRTRGVHRDLPLTIGAITVDPVRRRAMKDDRVLELTLKEFDLLRFLMEHADEVVSREDIMAEVWDEHWFGSTKTLDVHVSALRKKLGDPSYIRTVRGVGLSFVSPSELAV